MRTTDEILNKIKELKGLKNDAALARLFKVKANTITNWRQRNSIPYNYIVTLCEHEKWSISWLFAGQINVKVFDVGGEKVLTTADEPGLYKLDLVADEKGLYTPVAEGKYVYVPQVTGRISAGSGRVPEEDAEVRVAFRREWIRRKGDADQMVLIKVEGDSMEPTLMSGDLVLVDRGRAFISPDGGVYAIALDDTIMVKRVQVLHPIDKLRIISDNKKYDPIEIPVDQVKVNGKVIWFARELER